MRQLFSKSRHAILCLFISLIGLAVTVQPASAKSRTERVIELINQMDEDELEELQEALEDEADATDTDSDDDEAYPSTRHQSRSYLSKGFNMPVTYSGEPAVVLTAMNRDREKLGLDPLIADKTLTDAAKERAQEIRTLFEYQRLDGRDALTIFEDYGIDYSYAGENIAYGDGMKGKQAYRGWYNSQGHYENMMSGHFTHIGIGYFRDGNGRGYWVQLFGAPQN